MVPKHDAGYLRSTKICASLRVKVKKPDTGAFKVITNRWELRLPKAGPWRNGAAYSSRCTTFRALSRACRTYTPEPFTGSMMTGAVA
jgi:hypothetical protein